jgi:hypothetical protein
MIMVPATAAARIFLLNDLGVRMRIKPLFGQDE